MEPETGTVGTIRTGTVGTIRVLPFLAFLEFLAFFPCKDFLVFPPLQGFPCSSERFPFLFQGFLGSEGKKNPCFFGGFPCLFPKKARKGRTGIFPGTESGTGTVGTVFQKPKPEPCPFFKTAQKHPENPFLEKPQTGTART